MVESEADQAPRKTKAERLAEVHQRAMKRMDAIWSVEKAERLQSLADRRFRAVRGAMWEGQYAFGADVDENGDPIDTGSPRMEVPKFLRAIRRVKGEYRASRKTVDFKPKGGDASKEAANNLDGLFRADENDSFAHGGGQLAYDNCFGEGIDGGRGALRLRSVYEDESDPENEHQRIRIEPVFDADISVFFDPDCKTPDKLGSRWAIALFTLSREAFEAAHPKADPTTFSRKYEWGYDWVRPDDLTLAEYFEVEDRSVLRRTFRLEVDGQEIEDQTHDDADLQADDGKLERELLEQGFEEVGSRRIKRQRVRKYLMSGAECLKDEGELPGEYIPLAPYYAEHAYIDGIERAQGMVRPVIDATRINNLVITQLAESAAGPSGQTPVVAPEQVDSGILAQWADRKVKRPAVLLLKPIYNETDGTIIQAGPSGFIEPDTIPQATGALMQIMGGTIDELMGVNAGADEVPANTSSAAIQLVHDRADANDFLWQDNWAITLTVVGTIWRSMARDLYVEPDREMVALDKDGKKSTIKLADPELAEDGSQTKANDLTRGSYDVIVDVGPATKTRRDATVRNCLGIAQQATALAGAAPQAGGIALAMLGTAIVQMEGEGIQGPQEYVRKLGLEGGWIEPTEEEQAEMEAAAANQQAQPDPAAIIAQAELISAQAEQQSAQAKLFEAETRRLKAESEAQLTRAKVAQIAASIESDGVDQALKIADQEHQRVKDEFDATLRVEDHDNRMNGADNGNAA